MRKTLKKGLSASCLLSALGLSSCALPPIHIYHVSTGYFLTEKTAGPLLDKKIELYVNDPTAEQETNENGK